MSSPAAPLQSPASLPVAPPAATPALPAALPDPARPFTVAVWAGYASVGAVVVACRDFYADERFLASRFGLAQHVSTVVVDGRERARTRLQHACGDADLGRGLARARLLLDACDAAGEAGLAARMADTGAGNERPIMRALERGNLPLARLLCERGAAVKLAILFAIYSGHDELAAVFLERDPACFTHLETVVVGSYAKRAGRRLGGGRIPFDLPDADDTDTLKAVLVCNFLRRYHPGYLTAFEERGMLESIDGALRRAVERDDFRAADALAARDGGVLARARARVAERAAEEAGAAPAVGSALWLWARFFSREGGA